MKKRIYFPPTIASKRLGESEPSREYIRGVLAKLHDVQLLLESKLLDLGARADANADSLLGIEGATARIVACFNALTGIGEPAAYIKALQRLHSASCALLMAADSSADMGKRLRRRSLG